MDDENVDLDAFEFMSGRGEPSISISFKPVRGHVEVSCATVSKTGKSDLGDRDTSGLNSALEPAMTISDDDVWSDDGT